MIGDLLAQAENMSRYIYLFDNGNFTTVNLFGDEKIRDPNSNAFIDLDHDFIPDLFIEGENVYEYFYLKPITELSKKEANVRIFKPDEAIIGMSTFIDYNSDGVIDHLIPVCHDYGCRKDSSIVLWRPSEISYVKIASKFVDPNDKKKRLCFVKEFDDRKLIIPMKLRHTGIF